MGEGRRRYFAVADSIADENWSNDELAALVRLMARMNSRWARDGLSPQQAATIHLGPTEIMAISGKRRVDVAAKSLRHLADIASMSVECLGDIVAITWSKFPDFQNYENRARPQRGRSASASASASAEEKRERESAPPAPAAPAARPPAPKRVLIGKPDILPDESKERLRAWAARKGFDRSVLNEGLDVFRDWEPKSPPYRRTLEQWESAFKKIVREGVADGKLGRGKPTQAKLAYRRDDSGQVLVPNEWKGVDA